MKLKLFIFPIIIFLVGASFSIIGVLFKILHWGFGVISASLFLAIGSLLEVLGIVAIIVVLLRFYFRKEN
ncbi:MAG: hypothetical protein JKY22_01935 [Flavobacteriaceae bacterium]|nr:hypothetical protein [Flavobacteriaceae bacterium]